jgi:alkylation response protein AidB-like acyl-CoA dehydrogenase
MPFLHFGSEEQRKKFLPVIATGRRDRNSDSEARARSDITAINTRAKKDGDLYVLTAESSGAVTALLRIISCWAAPVTIVGREHC